MDENYTKSIHFKLVKWNLKWGRAKQQQQQQKTLMGISLYAFR
jgi:hypothetical protein